jgi:hypothetical protein
MFAKSQPQLQIQILPDYRRCLGARACPEWGAPEAQRGTLIEGLASPGQGTFVLPQAPHGQGLARRARMLHGGFGLARVDGRWPPRRPFANAAPRPTPRETIRATACRARGKRHRLCLKAHHRLRLRDPIGFGSGTQSASPQARSGLRRRALRAAQPSG